jgi:hypothetical protein
MSIREIDINRSVRSGETNLIISSGTALDGGVSASQITVNRELDTFFSGTDDDWERNTNQ